VLQFNGWAKVKWGNYGKLLIKHNNSPYLALSFLDISLLDKGCGLLFYKVYAYFLHKLNYSFFSRANFFFFHYLPKAGYNAFFFNKVYNYIFKGIYALLYYSVFKYIEKGIFDFL
jgi:hypothetical protein